MANETGFIVHPKESLGTNEIGTRVPTNPAWDSSEYDGFYVAHRDIKNPEDDPLGHLWQDAPHWILVIGILLSALVILVAAWIAGRLSRST